MLGFIIKLCRGGGNSLRPRQFSTLSFHNNNKKQMSLLPACFHTNTIHYTTNRHPKTSTPSALLPKNCNSIRTLSTAMARSYDYYAHDNNFDFEEYNDVGEPSSLGNTNQQQQSQQQRRADEFDSMFFTPISSKPKASGEKNTSLSPTYNNVDNNSAQDVSNFNNKPTTRPRATASSTNNDQQSRRNTKTQASQQDILSTRALYQFHPGSGGREIPPSISDYDSYEDDYNNINVVEEEENNIKGVDMDIYVANNDAEEVTNHDNTGDTMSSSSTNFFDDDIVKVEQPMKKIQKTLPSPEKEVAKSASSSDTTPITKTTDSMSSMSKPSFPRARARAVTTPSFMEPIKTKSLIDLSSTTVRNSSSSKQQRIPSEASSGNGSTSHLTTLMHQLEHLTSQIYQLNNGIEFNINSPKQVAIVLFGEDCTGDTSTNKDVLEAMSSAGNEMAASIYKFRKLSREIKREERRMKQQEKGDSKNDYYGNLARLHSAAADDAKKNASDTANVEMFQTVSPINKEVSATTTTDNIERRREPLLLIDISAYIYRAYHAIPPLHHSDGTPTGALHGVCRMLQNLLLPRLLKGDRPRVVLAFDVKGPNFRHEVYPAYKANRGPAPDDLVPQFALVREAAEAFGIDQVEAEGWEADDVIATLAMQARNDGVDVDILSGDKDLMQLITPPGIEPSIHMVDPMHFERVDHDDVVKKWGVSSEKLGDLLALAGDSSDNIPGCPGIGPKIAATLINEFGSLDDLLEQAGTIKQNKRRENLIENAEKVRLSRKLVTLDDSIPISKMTLPPSFQDISSLRMSTFDPNTLLDFYKRMELNTIQNQLESRLRSSGMNFKQPPTPDEYKDVPF